MYRRIQPKGISTTAEQLCLRVSERFPNSGLSKVAAELADIARNAEQRAAHIVQPVPWLRTLVIAGIAAMFTICIVVFVLVHPRVGNFDLSQFMQILDGTVNVTVITGGVILSLVTVENRVRRSRALKAAHELRALAHVIDMHQLTKDPDRVTGATQPTKHSPDVKLTPAGLARYLNYCSEMLSLIGKIGAYYVQDLGDSVALETVNDLESLTTGLSQKIWQKIMIVHQTQGHTDAKPRPRKR